MACYGIDDYLATKNTEYMDSKKMKNAELAKAKQLKLYAFSAPSTKSNCPLIIVSARSKSHAVDIANDYSTSLYFKKDDVIELPIRPCIAWSGNDNYAVMDLRPYGFEGTPYRYKVTKDVELEDNMKFYVLLRGKELKIVCAKNRKEAVQTANLKNSTVEVRHYEVKEKRFHKYTDDDILDFPNDSGIFLWLDAEYWRKNEWS